MVETWEEHLKPTFNQIVAIIRDEIIPWIKENKEVFITAWMIIRRVVVGLVKSLFIQIETAIGVFTAIFRTLLAVLTGDWAGAWQGIKDFFEEIWEGIVGIFDAFGIDLQGIMKGIVNGVIGHIEAIPNAFISAINSIIRAWNGLSLKLPGFQKKVLGKTFGFKSITINTPNISTLSRVSIPRLASGGIVTRPTLAEIGEREPEAVIPLSKLGRYGGGGSGNIKVVIELDGERLGEYVINRVNQGSRNGELDLVGA